MTLSRPDDFDAEELPIHDRKQGVDSPAELSESTHYQPGSVEFSEPLESSVPLEAPRVRYIPVPNPPASVPVIDERSPSISQPVSQPITPATLANQPHEVVIPLLDERLVIDRRRRKVGEVVVRKEIETHIVEVPIRREKLIVEQVSPEYQQIAVVQLGQAQVTEFDTLEAVEVKHSPTVSGEFASANAAIHFLSDRV
ncbi:MAG: DUF2382 domain-containing protein [Microcystaceae cyanobacterium]